MRCGALVWQPLFIAAEKGHHAVVRELLRHGAPHNKTEAHKDTRGGASALHAAAGAGHKRVVETVIQHFMDNKILKDQVDAVSPSPLPSALCPLRCALCATRFHSS